MATTLQIAVNKAYLRATGKPGGLDLSTTKGQRLTQLIDFFQQDWAGDRTTDWHSLRKIYTVSVLVTATDTFDLSSLTDLGHVSRQEGDFLRITSADGKREWDYEIVPASRLYGGGMKLNAKVMTAGGQGLCAQVGNNLVFGTAFVTGDPQIGGTIKFPGYYLPATVSAAGDLIVVDDPEWLEVRAAAEFVRNDITRVQLFPSLMDEANDKMADMRVANDTQDETAATSNFGLLGQTWS